MGRVKLPYYVVRHGRGYWQPTKAMKKLGFVCVACGEDGPEAWARAAALNKKWREWRAEGAISVEAPPPRNSLAEAFARYRKTPEWEKKAPRTREDWERAWRHIEPVFGKADPADVKMDHISRFRAKVERDISQREAHRCIKIWRALWRVAASLGYGGSKPDPSSGVRNTEPERRQSLWSHAEARKLAKTAWRGGYRGLAAIIAVAWDSSLSPVDARKLTPEQRIKDAHGDAFSLDRAKTGRAAVATLSRPASRMLDAYLAQLGAEVAPNAPIFRNRSGSPYTKDKLGDDFRDVRTLAFGAAEKRTLADFRRSGAIEALRGGASLTEVGQKLANDVGSNAGLARTYTPVDLAAVRKVDEARKRGRK